MTSSPPSPTKSEASNPSQPSCEEKDKGNADGATKKLNLSSIVTRRLEAAGIKPHDFEREIEQDASEVANVQGASEGANEQGEFEEAIEKGHSEGGNEEDQTEERVEPFVFKGPVWDAMDWVRLPGNENKAAVITGYSDGSVGLVIKETTLSEARLVDTPAEYYELLGDRKEKRWYKLESGGETERDDDIGDNSGSGEDEDADADADMDRKEAGGRREDVSTDPGEVESATNMLAGLSIAGGTEDHHGTRE